MRSLALAVVVLAFTGCPAAIGGPHMLSGTYLLPDDTLEPVEATFVSSGADSWEVEFRFTFQGRDHVWNGVAFGDLENGPLEGTVHEEKMNRTFVFRGQVEKGVLEADHAELEHGGETPTGTMTLAP